MSVQTKKKTLAQLRAEKEQRRQDFEAGCLIVDEVGEEYFQRFQRGGFSAESFHDLAKELLVKAKRACQLVEYDPDSSFYRQILLEIGRLHYDLGEHTPALAALRLADELYMAAERKGFVSADEQEIWKQVLRTSGNIFLASRQLEAAKACFLKQQAAPRLDNIDRVSALKGMAHSYKERKKWKQMMQCCEEALTFIPKANENCAPNQIEERMLILLADAAEGLGDMKRAQEFNEKARKTFRASGLTKSSTNLMSCKRREAIRLLAAEKPLDAALALARAPEMYANRLHYTGINLMDLHDVLQPIMAALKVQADAMVQVGIPKYVAQGELIRADVEETEAILAGYWEGVLEETRWELAEQRRVAAVATVTHVEAQAEAAAVKKSKAANRKQQKRKAQQQKKAAEKAEAAGREEAQQTEGEGDHGGLKEDGNPPDVTAAAAALSAMAVSGVGGQVEEKEQEQGDECSVCLNAIESDDADNPADPPLMCGHRYHAFCLRFWVERCTSKCIEPTCPYCRSPLHEMESI